jgi:HAMP domain-containing protein
MVGSIDTARKWADELIAPVGTYAVVDDLLRNNKISIEEYTAAQEAQIDITAAYGKALEATQVIQTMQAPLIAEQTEAVAAYLTELSTWPAQEQAVALAWADSDYAGRATEIGQLATEWKHMTDEQKAGFESMILSAASADPLMAALLEKMGIINTTDGVITLDYGVLGDATSGMDTLILRIEDLVEILAQGFDININYGAVRDASDAVLDLGRDLANLDGASATITTYHYDVETSNKFANGGVVGFATGGMVPVRLAELGPELLHFANGGTAIAPRDGAYMVPEGTLVSTAAASATHIGKNYTGPQIHFAGGMTIVPPTPDMHAQSLSNLIMQGL